MIRDFCWLWATTAVDGGGYGVFGRRIEPRGRTVMFKAHRVMYEDKYGEVPNGTELDHLCRQSLCINPDHLEPVTHKENVLRGLSPPAQKARQETCLKGHPFRDRRTKRGNRVCLSCKAERQRKYNSTKELNR